MEWAHDLRAKRIPPPPNPAQVQISRELFTTGPMVKLIFGHGNGQFVIALDEPGARLLGETLVGLARTLPGAEQTLEVP